MKRLLLSMIILVSCTSLSLFAFDFGVNLENLSSYNNETLGSRFSQRNTVALWASLTNETYQAKIEAFYKFAGDITDSGTTFVPFRFDIGNAYLQVLLPSFLIADSITMAQVGRFDFQDSASRIINAKADGFLVRNSAGSFETTVQVGYTGLQYKKEANIALTESELADNSNESVYFAPSRLFVDARFKVLEIVERHDLGIEVLGQFDLYSSNKINTFYAELFAEGRPLQWFKWKAYGISELWAIQQAQLSLAAGYRLQFSFPELMGLIVVQNTEWASGTSDTFRQYSGLNQTPVAQIFAAPFSDIITSNVNVICRPARGMVLGTAAYALIRASNQPVADPEFPKDGTAPYLGTEVVSNLSWSITSELDLNFTLGAFIPNTMTGAYPSTTKPRLLGSFEFKLEL